MKGAYSSSATLTTAPRYTLQLLARSLAAGFSLLQAQKRASLCFRVAGAGVVKLNKLYLSVNRNLLTRYWIEIDTDNPAFKKIGITAYSLGDAFNILKDHLPFTFTSDLIVKVKEDLDYDELDQNHIVPNMGPISERGIWYPWIL